MTLSTKPIPSQEALSFDSFLLKRTVTFDDLYTLPQDELDLLIAETAAIQMEPDTRPGKRKLCGYFKELAVLITNRKLSA
jgi:hypothetical protein